jgi:ABC-type uncharacterized transport system ATPase subunit
MQANQVVIDVEALRKSYNSVKAVNGLTFQVEASKACGDQMEAGSVCWVLIH